MLASELQILRDLPRSEHVVALIGSAEKSDGSVVVLMELLDTSLASLMSNRREDMRLHRMPEWFELDELWAVATGILNGVSHLHTHKCVHRDIKPDNVLLELGPGEAPVRAVLADFGASAASVHSLLATQVGTFQYMAPELQVAKQYDGYLADMYSTGIVLFEWLAGVMRTDSSSFPDDLGSSPKFPAARHEELLEQAAESQGFKHAEVLPRLIGVSNDDAASLLCRSCDRRPARRPGIDAWTALLE
jgi:serine/threonine protein kinase